MVHVLRILFCSVFILGLGCHTQAQVSWVDTLPMVTIKESHQSLSEVFIQDSISKAQIDEGGSLVSALRRSQALFVKDYGPGNIANVVFRGGTTQQTSVYWNGMPINSPSLGLLDLSLIPGSFIDEVLIQPGAASLLTGNGGLAGAIQLNSSTGNEEDSFSLIHQLTPALAETKTGLVYTQGEENWSSRTSIHSYQADNAFRYVDDSSREEKVLERENADIRSKGVSQDLSFNLGLKTRLNAHVNYIDMERGIASPIGIPDRMERQSDASLKSMLSLEHLENNTRHEIALGYLADEQDYDSPEAMIHSEIRTRRAHVRYQMAHHLNTSTFLRIRLDHNSNSSLVDKAGTNQLDVTGLYTELEHAFGEQLKVDFGLRQEYANSDLRPWTAAAGFRFSPERMNGFSFSASFSKNHRAPTLNDLYWPELGDPDLDPENGFSGDLSFHLDKEWIGIRATGFYSEMKDLINWRPGSDGRFRPVNQADFESQGFEVNLELGGESAHSADFSYVFLDARVKEEFGDGWAESLYQPEHLGRLGYHLKAKRSDVHLYGSYSSSILTGHSSVALRDPLPHILLLDLGYDWRPKLGDQRVEFQIELKNLLDKNYEYVRDRPIPGRYVRLKLIINILNHE